jgi:hypothetical protein
MYKGGRKTTWGLRLQLLRPGCRKSRCRTRGGGAAGLVVAARRKEATGDFEEKDGSPTEALTTLFFLPKG